MSRHLPDVNPAPLPMAEGSSPDLLRELLSEWEHELRRAGYPFEECTNPGVAPGVTSRVFEKNGLVAPEELEVWFQWRNGQPVRAPGLTPWFTAGDLDFVIEHRSGGLERGHGQDYWEESWVRLGQHDPTLTIDTTNVAPAPFIRVTHFDVGSWNEDDTSDIRSLCTAVTWFIEALRGGVHRWDPAGGRLMREKQPYDPANAARWVYQ